MALMHVPASSYIPSRELECAAGDQPDVLTVQVNFRELSLSLFEEPTTIRGEDTIGLVGPFACRSCLYACNDAQVLIRTQRQVEIFESAGVQLAEAPAPAPTV